MILKLKIYLPNKALRLILGGDPELAIQKSSLGNLKHYLYSETGLSLQLRHR